MFNSKEIARRLTENSQRAFQGCVCYPQPDAIAKMIKLLRSALLPNYFPYNNLGLERSVEATISELQQVLAAQIHRALFEKCYDLESSQETRHIADERAADVLQHLPELQTMLYEDVVETQNSDPAASSEIEIILTYPGLLALSIYRMAHVLVQYDIPLLPRMMTEYGHRLTGIDLHPGASIGHGIMIDHGTGIVVGETAQVGNHVKIYQGVTLGALYFPRDEQGILDRQTKRHPTVEDYVVLYANATVLGGDTVIGHHSVIGSSAWVTESIPPYSRVVHNHQSVVTKRQKSR
ncbi:serine O-acetyltransferase EpsC [Alicyclobacillus tolerans]|uniref:Serine O-acetyltransferase n=2 Tax=Alicyclobacillus tolerans TaxID=90970 RepID=A0ABT9LUP1_9BACL|nr:MULTISPECIES: serine O-acetyltransferase EpsC [Alicyclobacillus]MDP9727982.1 serine O-acetyltransferase [Alicyclobacillus tengchongensis]SHK91447.1 serine O-acetyltransferase [Alicyclobacillus montanus]